MQLWAARAPGQPPPIGLQAVDETAHGGQCLGLAVHSLCQATWRSRLCAIDRQSLKGCICVLQSLL